MGAVEILRDALFGNPPRASAEPSREGVLAAFTQLYDTAVVAQYAAVAGLNTVPTLAARDTFYATAENRGKLVYVNNQNGSATDPANGVYEYAGGAARLAQSFYAGVATVVQPLIDHVDDVAESLEAVADAVTSVTVGLSPVAAGAVAFSNTTCYFDPLTVSDLLRYITAIKAPIQTAGAAIVSVAKVESNGNLTALSATTINFPVTGDAVSAILPAAIEVPVGAVVGIQLKGATAYYLPTGGNTNWTTPGLPMTSTPKTVSAGNKPIYQYTLSGEVVAKVEIAYDTSIANQAAIGAITTIGWGNIAATGSDTDANYNVFPDVATGDGYVTAVQAGTAYAGDAAVTVIDIGSDGKLTIVSSTTIKLSPGARSYAVRIPVKKGQRVGLVGGRLKFTAFGAQGVASFNRAAPPVATGDTYSPVLNHRFELAFTVASGLMAGVGGGSSETIFADDPRLIFSDYDQVSDRAATRFRPRRRVVDGQGYEWCSPNTRLSFHTTSDFVELDVTYNGSVNGQTVRDDGVLTFYASVLCEGVEIGALSDATHSTASVPRSARFDLPGSGVRRVDLVWPYGKAMDFNMVRIAAGGGVGKVIVPTRKIVFGGDSTVQGFTADRTINAWTFGVAKDLALESVNMGYGGRQANVGDGTSHGAIGAALGVYVIGINDKISQKNPATFKTEIMGYISNWFAANPVATSRLALFSATWTQNEGAGAQGYTMQQYRDAMSSAVTDWKAANPSLAGRLFFKDGLSLFTNAASRMVDAYHPNNTGQAEWRSNAAAFLATVLPS